MKVRKGFVSNSSTSSFIIAKEDEGAISTLLNMMYELNSADFSDLKFNEVDEIYQAEYDWWLSNEDLGKIHIIGNDNDMYLMKCMEILEQVGFVSHYRHGG